MDRRASDRKSESWINKNIVALIVGAAQIGVVIVVLVGSFDATRFASTQNKTDLDEAKNQLAGKINELSAKLDESQKELSKKIEDIPTDHQQLLSQGQAIIALQQDLNLLRDRETQDVNTFRDRQATDENNLTKETVMLENVISASNAQVLPRRH